MRLSPSTRLSRAVKSTANNDAGARETGRPALTIFQLAMIGFMALYSLFVGLLYGQQRRWSAAFGWILLVGGIVALSAGLGATFPWGGLAFLFLAATGGLLLVLDLAARRAQRR